MSINLKLSVEETGSNVYNISLQVNSTEELNEVMEALAKLSFKARKISASLKQGNSGANGMVEGDRVFHTPSGRYGIAGEFLQDGDVDVYFEDGVTRIVKWNNLAKAPL